MPISKQSEFKSIKNMIIKEADQLSQYMNAELEFQDKSEEKENFETEISNAEDELNSAYSIYCDEDFKNEYDFKEIDEEHIIYAKWTEKYKEARAFLFGTDEIQQNFSMALELYMEEAKKGNALAMFDAGRIFSYGLGVNENKHEADEWYKKALAVFKIIENKRQWKYAEYRIGKMYEQGLGTQTDYKEAIKWYEMSSDKGYKFAQYSLGGMYHLGKGTDKDLIKAFKLYLSSAEQGFPYAQFEAAKMYQEGVAVNKDDIKAEMYFKLAFKGFEKLEEKNHDDKLQYRLGHMLLNGTGIEIDIKRAKEYFKKSAKLGNIYACYSFAKTVLSEEVSKAEEVIMSIEYLEKASKSGNQFAQYTLGKIYLDSKYLPKDIEKAVKYLTESAEQGNQYAQYTLGKIYLLGKEIEKDREKAVKWLTLSAEQGNIYAKMLLDNIDNIYFPKNNIEKQSDMLHTSVIKLFNHLSRIFETSQTERSSQIKLKTDSKLKLKLNEKKISQGHKLEGYQDM